MRSLLEAPCRAPKLVGRLSACRTLAVPLPCVFLRSRFFYRLVIGRRWGRGGLNCICRLTVLWDLRERWEGVIGSVHAVPLVPNMTIRQQHNSGHTPTAGAQMCHVKMEGDGIHLATYNTPPPPCHNKNCPNPEGLSLSQSEPGITSKDKWGGWKMM